MKKEIGKQFNTLTLAEYHLYIDNHKQYGDFNTLGLYRSIIENEHLSLEEKISLRDYAHQTFQKTFDFLQLKDPQTYLDVSTLGIELTKVEERQLWDKIRTNQQKILSDKKIKHRNFGEYSKHHCGYEDCVYNGLMIRQGSPLAESNMHFDTDKDKSSAKSMSKKHKSDRKKSKQMIDRDWQDL